MNMEKAASGSFIFSLETQHLKGQVKNRYLQKVNNLLLSADPYCLPWAMFKSLQCSSIDELPQLEYADIYNYLVNKTSVYSSDALKAYKSLEGYKYFVAGWVQQIGVKALPERKAFLLRAKILHSQALSSTPLCAWIAIESNGLVTCGHCTCMAGLGEACSHIAATLFATEAAVRMRASIACTSMPCEWAKPSAACVPYAEGSAIEFVSPLQKRKNSENHENHNECERTPKAKKVIAAPTADDNNNLYAAVHATGVKSAVLSLLNTYSAEYIPRSVQLKLPSPLLDLFNPSFKLLADEQLLDKCEEVFKNMHISPEEAALIESETRKQTASRIWFQQRSGRITASHFKAAAHTKLVKPSMSLIKAICYPKAVKFSTAATRWGCEHEKIARAKYVSTNAAQHSNVSVADCGFFISTVHTHLGASPDGVVSCDCCGRGIVEIKCPYCKKDSSIETAADDKSFWLEKRETGIMTLRRNHQYYYQVQLQLFVTSTSYCDFVVYTEGESTQLFVERIYPAMAFLLPVLETVKLFYVHVILAELLAHRYTELVESTKSKLATFSACTNADVDSNSGKHNNEQESKLWCYCQSANCDGPMILCQSGFCTRLKFHQTCLGLKTKPRRQWSCPDCRKLAKMKLPNFTN